MAFALMLAGSSFLMAVIWGGPLIRFLRDKRMGKQIRIEEPESNQLKMGTPTMGGLMMVIPVALLTLFLNALNLMKLTGIIRVPPNDIFWRDSQLLGESILLPVVVMVGFAALGALDDWEGVRARPGLGLSARQKFLGQLLLAGAAATVLYITGTRGVALPGVQQRIELPFFVYIPIAMIIIVGMSNAANLTDGLDGLAGLIMATVFLGYGIVAYLQEQVYLLRFAFTMVGACMAFLWYNAHPAELFMGDMGSQALGAGVGVLALMTGQWLLLPVIAFIPVAETVSVMLQVAYFKLTKGRRIFKMSPLHYHFVLLGWSETQVVQRFWLIGLVSGMVGIALALI
jgi:phospho-N-acetylmuramoyl-pentapeptide-transferase